MADSLQQLPAVFSLADLKQVLDDEAAQAPALLLEWLDSGVVSQVAPPRPVFIRSQPGQLISEADRCQALLRAFPSVIIAGGSALWRQQLSREQDVFLDCCVQESERACSLPDVRLHWRPMAWWDAIRETGGVAGYYHGVPVLSVELALADATTFADLWMPDQAMIDWSRLSSSRLQEAKEQLLPLKARD